MRVLLTGSHGFTGTHVREILRARKWEVFGLGTVSRMGVDDPPGETYRAVDLCGRDALAEVVEEADPDLVIHLAARTGHGGEEAASRAFEINVEGTRNLFGALEKRGREVRVVVAGTSAQYGDGPDPGRPVEETDHQRPLGLYGWTKIAAEAIAMAHHGRAGIEVIAVRAFNHVGPGEPEHLACSGFAHRIVRIERGAEPVLLVGNLEPIRDFTDVRDIARGYLDLAERGTPGRAYNLCSGQGTRIETVLGMLLDKAEATVEVRADPSRMRAAELMSQVGSFARAERDAGWRPRFSLGDSLGELLDEWRERLGSAKESRS